jgi:IclR family transcriptional regulator, KDG regulon repressor
MESGKTKNTASKVRKSYSTPAVEQAARVMFCLAKSPSIQMGLTEICKEASMHASTTFAILEALQKFNLIKRGKNGKGYSLGQGLLTLSRKFLDDLKPSRIAEQALERLTKVTDRTSVFGLIMEDFVTITAKHNREGNMLTLGVPVGRIMPLTQGAHGKAIVAFLSDEERELILSKDKLNFHGSPDSLDRPRLLRELKQCRKNGFACDFEESVEGINIIAAPVIGTTGSPIGFVAIFDHSSSARATQLGPMVAKTAISLSQELGADIE